jgi:hypothetical protein
VRRTTRAEDAPREALEMLVYEQFHALERRRDKANMRPSGDDRTLICTLANFDC